MNSFENKSGNFINSIVDDTIVLESVTEELDSYDLDDDSVMESVIDMVMEGDPNNREDAAKAGILSAKLERKKHKLEIDSRCEKDPTAKAKIDKRINTLNTRNNAIKQKYDKDLKHPVGWELNYYREAKHTAEVEKGGSIKNTNLKRYHKEQLKSDDESKNYYGGKYARRNGSSSNSNSNDDRKKAVLANAIRAKDNRVENVVLNESADDYDEFDRLVDEAIEEAEYYDHNDTQVSKPRGKIFESGDFDEYADCDEASEGLFTNDIVASVGKFREVGMSDEESRKAMKVLVVFAISNGMAKSNISKNTTELRKRDMHYLIGSGGFVKSFLSKWYRIADEDDTAKTFSDALNKEWAAYKKMLQDQTDQRRRVEVARAGAANINVNNSNRSYNYANSVAKASSIYEDAEDFDYTDIIPANEMTLLTLLGLMGAGGIALSVANNIRKHKEREKNVYDKVSWHIEAGEDKKKAISRFERVFKMLDSKKMLSNYGKEVLSNGITEHTSLTGKLLTNKGNVYVSKCLNSLMSGNANESYLFDIDDSDMVLEALFEKRTLDTVLQSYLKQLEKKLNTIEACDKFLALIKQDQAKFNNALKVCADAKIKLDKGQIDEKQFKNLTKSAAKQIAGYCKTFKLKMSDFGGGGSSAARNITKEDIANFKQYVTGLITGVRSIKKKRQAMYKEMNRKPGQKSTLRKDMVTANEAAFDDIFLVSDVDD